MAALGPYLRDLRERRGLSLEEMARATRVATRYLEALEADDFRSLPAPAFTKGFIRAWCQTAGADPEEALARYQEHSVSEQARVPILPPADSEGEAHVQARASSRGAVLVSFVLLVILGVSLFAVTLVLQAGRDRVEHGADAEAPHPVAAVPSASPGSVARVEPTAPDGESAATRENEGAATRRPEPASKPRASAARPAPVAPTPAPAPSATAALPGPPPSTPATPPAAAGIAAAAGDVASPYRLVARVSEPTWIRVRMGDGSLTEETIAAGEIREWVSNAPFVLTVGNAGGVTLELNGRELPPLGARGAVIPRLVVPPARQ